MSWRYPLGRLVRHKFPPESWADREYDRLAAEADPTQERLVPSPIGAVPLGTQDLVDELRDAASDVYARTPHGSYTFAVTGWDLDPELGVVLRLQEVSRAARPVVD